MRRRLAALTQMTKHDSLPAGEHMGSKGIQTVRLPDPIRACLFDLDGVLTDTAKVHAAAWKETVRCLSERARLTCTGEPLRPFDLERDYDEYVDGKPRFDGVRSFLASRDIRLPEGSPGDAPGAETVHGLGNQKDETFLRMIREGGVEPYPGSVRFVHAVRGAGLRTAVVSSSAHCREVLEAAGIEDLFEVRIDGTVVEREQLKGKPAPDTFLAAARRLDVGPRACRGVRRRARGRRGRQRRTVRLRRRGRPGRPRAGTARARSRRGGAGPGRADFVAVIGHHAYPAEPWAVRERELDLDMLAQSESIFALANGHLGLRGNLDEGEPRALSGTYLGGFYESHPLSYGERGYGFPEDGQTVVNVTDGKLIRLLVEDEPFDVHRGTLESHERVLDLRTGILERRVRWTSQAGRTVL